MHLKTIDLFSKLVFRTIKINCDVDSLSCDPKSVVGDFRLRQLSMLREFTPKHSYHILTYRERRFYNRIAEFDLPVSYYLADGDDDPTLEIAYDPVTELIFPEDAILFQAVLGREPKGAD